MILYFHGFTSGPESRKVQALASRMAERGIADQLICPQLPASPAAAIALADQIITAKVGVTEGNPRGTGETATLMGSSLGGFYATHLAEKHRLNAVLINPAVVAALELERYLGPQTWLYSGEPFDFTRQHIDELAALEVPVLADPARYWLLVEEGDETLDYRQAVARYAGARQTVLPGGDHSFTRWDDYLDEVLAFAGLK
ncbi:MAG: esterase [Gammaproteobacteria bacterium]|nr:esterase [Rhodocyclaceae bacterium]MBU3909267.1 esterase [Gammaproteobacteria bacterium]MBU3989539.1 esterase [Gammaproteobacteria bacterium]MBU4005573.1 esterase [Gammaproteobacteria bacterium]MBU4020874.1 esterase [Gammaproteobacteria bacterium]